MMESMSEPAHMAWPALYHWQKRVTGKTDFEIELQGCVVACHKHVLSKSSCYFNAMFLSSMKESVMAKVRLEGTDKSPFIVLLKFAYTQKLDINVENMFDVTSVANMYQFHAASEICQEYLVEKATTNLWAEILVFSEVHALRDARHTALRYILFYFNKEMERELENQFLQLPKHHVSHILGHPRLNCRSEIDVAVALDKWTNHEPHSRKDDFADLFRAVVRFRDLSRKELHDILNLNSVNEDPVSLKLVMDKIESLATENTEQSKHHADKRSRSSRPGPFLVLSVGGDMIQREVTSPCLNIYAVNTEKASMTTYASLDRILPTCRTNVGYRACVLGKDLFITGGEAVLGRNTWQMDVWKLDSFTKNWSCDTQLTQPRRHHGICVFEGSLILIGGMGRYRQVLNSVEKYNTVRNRWTSLCPLLRPEFWPAVAVCQRRIYVIKNCIQRYDPETYQWTILTVELPFNLGFNSAVSLGNSIYMKCQFDGRLVKLCPHLDLEQAVTVGEFSECPDGQLILHRDKIYVLGGSNSSNKMQYYDFITETFGTTGKPTHNIVGCSLTLLPDYSGEL